MFKYQSFSQYSLANLLNDQIFMNHYDAFNDPFECWCEVMTDFPPLSDKSTRLSNILSAWGFSEIDETVEKYYDDYVSSLSDTGFDPQKLADAAKITCFSKRADNLLMWSHYADGLRGFCIEFDPKSILGTNEKFASIYDVTYQSKPAVIDTALESVYSDQADYYASVADVTSDDKDVQFYDDLLHENIEKCQEIYMKMLATKPLEWSYEEEQRVIYVSSGGDDSLLSYPSSSIKRIIFGEKMPKSHIQTIENLLSAKGLNPEIAFAKRSSRDFKVQITPRI
ncbi:hypothetical protein ACOMICROBIO_LMKGKHOH_02206 [Vibrio sp. B1FIG11]|uniref:DUF2971 domain-containing protein n=1 Tax=Vibrio sp. B1FIG11 TaxID=2751177 RepID=UPI001AF08B63|nr:DUF2971 domain-containing protein [Vibrio sp. B1FIG11]CAD7806949.1 hypothetical protein ACOMICROBIO_LMKGKHOH_02206 [Vibrio sp. B1FIG11]CAE6903092.1 hypothetical protein ACOMICROBIO_LMKGKHOH_02206 [Vibrio sp. B1FIG11]